MNFEKTVHGIYDAAFDLSGYHRVASDISRMIGTDAAGYILHTTDTQQVRHAGLVHYDHLPIDEVLSEYAAHWHLRNPQVQFEQSHPDASIYYEGLDPRIDCSVKSEFGQWRQARMGGARSQLTSYCRPTRHLNFAFAFSSNQFDAPESKAQILLFSQLTSHLQRSVRLAYLLGTLGHQNHSWGDHLTRQGTAIAALSASGKMVVCNYAMERLALECDGLQLGAETFRLTDPDAHRQLGKILCNRFDYPHLAQHPALLLRNRMREMVGLLEVHPFTEHACKTLETHARFLVTIQRPSVQTQALSKRFELLLGLTRAEAQASCLLMRGLAAAQVAQALGVEVSTVRSHIKSILLKTGLKSKAELAHWLTMLR